MNRRKGAFKIRWADLLSMLAMSAAAAWLVFAFLDGYGQ